MGVFGKKGKAKDGPVEIPPAGGEVPASKMSRSLRRKQKNAPEQPFQLDLTSALPDTNDFRTSLILPGLSARFSMLREQDDPTTKVGKASDDSVLFPKRASRLNLFAHNPLTEISEDDPVATTFRPPFATADRSHSFSEGGYVSDDAAGVMARNRPTEGNNLFGGRQKMFKIPTASSSTPNVEGSSALTAAKHVYEKDIILSPYQQYRAKKEEERLREESRERPVSTDTDEHEYGSMNTPSTGFSKSRGTASSTGSGPSNRRTSTAATSVTSDAPYPRQSNVSSSSNARAQEYGSADSLLRRNFSSESRKAQPTNTTEPPLPRSPELSRPGQASRIGPEASPSPGMFATNSPRAMSPAPLQTQALASLDFGLKSSQPTARRYQTASPTFDQGGEVYAQNLQPNDRGKATAMGLFNRPRQQFDEKQFQERQMQMHAGRISPPSEEPVQEARRPEPSIPSSPLRPTGSSGTSTSIGMRSRAQSTASSTNQAQVQAHVEALIKQQNNEYAALHTTIAKPAALSPPKALVNQPVASRGTFFDTGDGSDEEEEADSPMLGRYEQPRINPMEVHPALRSPSQPVDFGNHNFSRPKSDASHTTSSPSIMHDTPDTSDSLHRSSIKSSESPTLGSTTGLGLSGLIRTHLRQDSDRSSLLPPSPGVAGLPSIYREQGAFRERETSIASTARTINPPESTHSDPWEFEQRVQRSPMEAQPREQIPTMSQKAQQILGQANFHRNQAIAHQTPGKDEEEHNAARSWAADMSHHRGASTETQKEFADELAERAKKIQEGLKNNGPTASRSRSPPRHDRPNPAAQAFQALRHKTSKTSLGPRGELQPNTKAMKMLGIADTTRVEAAPREPPVDRSPYLGNDRMDRPQMRPDHMDRPQMRPDHMERPQMRPEHMDRLQMRPEHRERPHMRPDHMERPRYPGRNDASPHMGGRPVDYDYDHSNRPTPKQRPAEFGPPRHAPGYGRPHPNSSDEDFEYSRNRAITPNQGRPLRPRAGSEAAERSRSRGARYRDEPPHGADHDRPHWEQRERPRGPPPVRRGPPPIEFERSSSAMSNHRPSGNGPRPAPAPGPAPTPNHGPDPAGYFDSRSATPTMASTPTLGGMAGPRPSPRPPFPASPISQFHPSPALSGLPSPMGLESGRSTPVDRTPGARKKSVTKGMISEPTFISSTSSVPLVGLPSGPRSGAPPLPVMNPRRRGNTLSESQQPQSPRHNPPPATYADANGKKPRNRLRKISSEGGSMAARARHQAAMAEFGHEKLRSPALPVFPNRSATSLGMHSQEGGMF